MAKEQKKIPIKMSVLQGVSGIIIHRKMSVLHELKKQQGLAQQEIPPDDQQEQPLGWRAWAYNKVAGVVGGAADVVPPKDNKNSVDDIQPAGDAPDQAE